MQCITWQMLFTTRRKSTCHLWETSAHQGIFSYWGMWGAGFFYLCGAWNMSQHLYSEPFKRLIEIIFFLSWFGGLCLRLTEDFCLCFEGVIAGGHSDDCRRGGFNNCGEMKWADFRRMYDMFKSWCLIIHSIQSTMSTDVPCSVHLVNEFSHVGLMQATLKVRLPGTRGRVVLVGTWCAVVVVSAWIWLEETIWFLNCNSDCFLLLY